jgi:hypothetical protein
MAVYGINIPPEMQVQFVLGFQAIVAVLTWAFKTFYTSTITPDSAGK